MYKIKKSIIVIMIISMLFSCFAFTTYADNAVSYEAVNGICISDIANDPDVIISDVMTVEETIMRYAQNDNITYEAAAEILGIEEEEHSSRSTYSEGRRVFSVYLNVTSTYRPHIEFFCTTEEGGHFFNITSIYSVQLVRIYNGISKQFNGELNYWQLNGTTIEYVINGDFYNNGTTVVSGGASAGVEIGEMVSIEFTSSITSESAHYAPVYVHETKIFA